MKRKGIFIQYFVLLLLLLACKRQVEQPPLTPWGEEADSVSADFDLDQIVTNGELIVLTLMGPDTYYEYRGRHLGTQYLLCQRFAGRLGVSVRVEVCRDSAEIVRKLADDEADLALQYGDSCLAGWLVGQNKPKLQQEVKAWYKPSLVAEVKKEEDYLLSARSVKRHVYAPMLNAKGGVISKYDAHFQLYARRIHWDWRLLAAQCYQESTFDPQARSWAGACGLMQIMPATADHLHLARTDLFHPERNIEAATRYLAELNATFRDIPTQTERTKFVLAAYNGGVHHVRDAMALAQKYGKNPRSWNDVSPYILGLATPQYYNDPVVKYGYMRGSETENYVRLIMKRWDGYRGVRSVRMNTMGMPQKATHQKKKYKI